MQVNFGRRHMFGPQLAGSWAHLEGRRAGWQGQPAVSSQPGSFQASEVVCQSSSIPCHSLTAFRVLALICLLFSSSALRHAEVKPTHAWL